MRWAHLCLQPCISCCAVLVVSSFFSFTHDGLDHLVAGVWGSLLRRLVWRKQGGPPMFRHTGACRRVGVCPTPAWERVRPSQRCARQDSDPFTPASGRWALSHTGNGIGYVPPLGPCCCRPVCGSIPHAGHSPGRGLPTEIFHLYLGSLLCSRLLCPVAPARFDS